MRRRGKVTVVVLTLLAWAVGLTGPVAPAQNQPGGLAREQPAAPGGKGASEPDAVRPIPVINVDEEMGGYLKDAREMIAAKDYARAIEVLQALLSRVEQCFVPTSDPRRSTR